MTTTVNLGLACVACEALVPDRQIVGGRPALHDGCALPPEPMIPRLEEILTHWQTSTPRSLQTKLGPSEVGDPCMRKLALKIVNPRAESGLKWAALLGLWAHGGIEVALEAWNRREHVERYLVEHRVEADANVIVGEDGQVGLGGRTDNFDTWTQSVIDWKVVGERSLARYRRDGYPGVQYETQAQLYAKGWERKGFAPREVRIVFLPRWSNNIRDGWEWSAPYDPEAAPKAVERLDFISANALAAEAGDIRWSDVPAKPDPFKCGRFCPYFRAETPPDREGCPGHTRVIVPFIERLAACTTSAEVRGLWYELRAEGVLDVHRSAVEARGAELKALEDEKAAIAVLEGAGFHR